MNVRGVGAPAPASSSSPDLHFCLKSLLFLPSSPIYHSRTVRSERKKWQLLGPKQPLPKGIFTTSSWRRDGVTSGFRSNRFRRGASAPPLRLCIRFKLADSLPEVPLPVAHTLICPGPATPPCRSAYHVPGGLAAWPSRAARVHRMRSHSCKPHPAGRAPRPSSSPRQRSPPRCASRPPLPRHVPRVAGGKSVVRICYSRLN